MTRASCMNSCYTSLMSLVSSIAVPLFVYDPRATILRLPGPCTMADLKTTANILRRALKAYKVTIAQRPDHFGLPLRSVIDAAFSCFFLVVVASYTHVKSSQNGLP